CDAVRCVTSKKAGGRGLERGKELPKSSHLFVLADVSEEGGELVGLRGRLGACRQQGQPSGAFARCGNQSSAKARRIVQGRPGLVGGRDEGWNLIGREAPRAGER